MSLYVFTVMALYKYFKPKPSTVLPDPEGPLSKMIPSSTIEAVSKSVEKVWGPWICGAACLLMKFVKLVQMVKTRPL